MNFSIELYNTDGNTTKDFFSIILCLVYVCFLGLWVKTCLKKQTYVHKIHILMGALLVVVTLDFICGPADKRCVKLTSNGDGWNWDWDVVFYVIKFMRVVLFYAVIMLICGGWSFLRPFVPVKEKMVLMIMILFNVVAIAMRDSNPFQKDWRIWERLFFNADQICFYTIMIPIRRTLSWSDHKLGASKVDGKKDAKTEIRMQLLVVFGLVYSFGVFMVKFNAVFNGEVSMPNYAKEEIWSLVFCMLMFYMFRPADHYCFVDVKDHVPERAKGIKTKQS